jgi:hypothetical protein
VTRVYQNKKCRKFKSKRAFTRTVYQTHATSYKLVPIRPLCPTGSGVYAGGGGGTRTVSPLHCISRESPNLQSLLILPSLGEETHVGVAGDMQPLCDRDCGIEIFIVPFCDLVRDDVLSLRPTRDGGPYHENGLNQAKDRIRNIPEYRGDYAWVGVVQFLRLGPA